MKTRAQVSFRDSIATRMLLVVLGLYLLIASAAALGQLWMNYRYQRSSIAQDLIDFEGTFGEGLAVDLRNMDEEGLKAGVEGMLRTPTIVGVAIENVEKVSVAVGDSSPRMAGAAIPDCILVCPAAVTKRTPFMKTNPQDMRCLSISSPWFTLTTARAFLRDTRQSSPTLQSSIGE